MANDIDKPASIVRDKRTGQMKLYTADGRLIQTVNQSTIDRVKKVIDLHRVGDKNIWQCCTLAGTSVKTYYNIVKAMPQLKDSQNMSGVEKAKALAEVWHDAAMNGKAFPTTSYDLLHIYDPIKYPSRKRLAEHGIVPDVEGVLLPSKLLDIPEAAKMIRKLMRMADEIDKDREDNDECIEPV